MARFDTIHLPRAQTPARTVPRSVEQLTKPNPDGVAVSVNVRPKSTVVNAEVYEEFYPLKAVNKPSVKRQPYYLWVSLIGVFIALMAGAVAFWYSSRNQSSADTRQNTTSSNTAASTAGSDTLLNDSSAASRQLNNSDQLSSQTYRNSNYGFYFTLPASWRKVRATELALDIYSGVKPTALISFHVPSIDGTGDFELLKLRVDEPSNYQLWSDEIAKSGKPVPPILTKTKKYYITPEYQATEDTTSDQATIQQIKDITAVFNSITAMDK